MLTKYPNPTDQPGADKPLMACSFTPSILQLARVHLPLRPAAHPASTRHSCSAARSPQSLWQTQNCYPEPGPYVHFSGTMARDANLSEGNPKSLSLGELGLCEMFRKDFLFFHLRGQTDDSYKKSGMGAQPSSGGAGGTHCP